MGELRSAVDVLAALDLDELDNATLGELIVETCRQRDRLDGLCHRLVSEHDQRLAWKADGARSEKQWLADRCRMSPGEAASRANTARNLDRLPETAQALADGTISAGQARVAAQAVRDLPGEALAGLDQLVADTGAATDAAGLRAAVDDYSHRVAADSLAARQERAWRTRRLNATRTADDGGALDARLDKIGLETVLTALAPLAAPRGEDDDRTPEQRRADALVELARRSLDGGGLPETGGVRPHVTVVVDLPALLGEPGAPAAQLDRLGAISGDAARRLACDAGICRVITNGRSQILDAGRSTRTVTPAQRRALAVRDGGCVKCRAPVAWCEAHRPRQPPPPAHPKGIDLGPTDLDNLCLLCWGATGTCTSVDGRRSAAPMAVGRSIHHDPSRPAAGQRDTGPQQAARGDTDLDYEECARCRILRGAQMWMAPQIDR